MAALSACITNVASAETHTALDDMFFGFPPMYGMPRTPFAQIRSRGCDPASTGPQHAVKENDDQITITFDVAGFKEDEIAVFLESNILKIAGNHKVRGTRGDAASKAAS